MTDRPAGDGEWDVVRSAVARLRARIMAIVFGIFAGAGLFLATLWLVIRGGDVVGPHLVLLSNYFPGYSVSVGGAFLGGFYAALLGAAVGWWIAWVYNRVADLRDS